MLEPIPPSRHPVGDHLRAAADLLERTAACTAPDPWACQHGRVATVLALAGPLAEWLRSAAQDAEAIGADLAALVVADVILGGDR